MATSRERKVFMAHSSLLIQTADSHPKFTGRATLISSLIEAYNLHKEIKLVSPEPAGHKDLTLFHSSDYISFILTKEEEEEETDQETLDEYGLSATVTMVKTLVTGEADVAINWYGGWHHGQKDEAAGFCYCNDIVIGILNLLKHYQRVLYIDIDIHHGDGVQDAFSYSSKVVTLSFHKHSPGFYPGTGSVDDTGSGSGHYHSINVPLWDGINDQQYVHVFKSIVEMVHVHYSPQVVVLQCGADCLAGDPLGGFNLSLQSIGSCLQVILNWKLPTLLLGGGGYHFPNTARCWTYLTSLTVGKELSNDIPDHQYFPSYGPDYQLEIEQSNCKNEATDSTITKLIEKLSQNIIQLSSSV